MGFKVQLCSAPTNSQSVGRHTGAVAFCESPANISQGAPKSPEAAAKCNRPTFAEHRRFVLSQRMWEQEQRSRKAAFVAECQELYSMLGASRQAQFIAARMALEAVWYYRVQQRQQRAKLVSRSRSQLLTSAADRNARSDRFGGLRSDEEKAADNLLRAIHADVAALMWCPTWQPDPKRTSMEHPYLYTMNELNKQQLFTTVSSCHGASL